MNSAVLHPQPETAPEILRLDDVRVRFPVSNDWLNRAVAKAPWPSC